ncbi:MAG: TonB-dependent receptor [Chitinophagaceae bacterium]|nr:TonB-dependent receptor [Chitinophagaceae bacterium]
MRIAAFFRYFISLLLCCCILPAVRANTISFVLSGTIVNERSEPMPGANIKVIGSSNKGATADVYGKFLLEVDDESDSILVTFVGYKSLRQRVSNLGGRKDVIIKMEPDHEGQKLNETVVVGFGSQKKNSVTGAIATVKVSDLQQVATPSLSNAIGGRLPGVITRQTSGEPGYDAANVFIRGLATFTGSQSPLILVDGVERDMNQLNVQEVESFSILKDASATAVYGIRGANGVILINTKRGKEGKPQVSFRTENAQLSPLRLPKFINSYEYATLANEAMTRGGAPQPFYTPDQVEGYRTHSDPYLYPDVDWVSVVLRKHTFQTINNLSITGGNQTFKYYTNVGYTVQQGLYNEDKTVPYPTNTSYKRYNFRSNVDVNLSKSLSMSLNLGGITSNGNYPGNGAFLIMEAINLTPNNAYPVRNPDGSIPGSGTFLGMSPFSKTTQSGYTKEFRSTIQSSLGTKWDLSSLVTKGLYLRGLFAYDFYDVQGNGRPKQPQTYQYLGKDANGVDQYKLILTETPLGYTRYNVSNRAYYLEASANYDRTFGKHTVNGLLLGNRREYVDLTAGTSIANIPFRRQGLAARVTYDYSTRYLVQFDMGYNGSENFPPGKRYGFFPSVSLGWVPSKEKFWNVNVINYLKIRGSYGKSGNDQIGGARFLYQTTIDKGAENYLFGQSQTTVTSNGFAEAMIGNNNLSWEVSEKANIGTDMELFNGRVTLTVDAFREHRTGILLQLQQIPSSAGYPGSIIPYANLGAVNNHGIEGNIEVRNRTRGGFYYSFQGNFTFARNKVIEDNTPLKQYPYQNSRGQSINRFYGFVADGIYKDQADVDKGPDQTYLQTVIRPGDIKYKDLNGDGKIDANDQTFIGFARTPEIMFGFGGTVAYKGVDLSIFFAGAARTSMYMSGRSTWAFADGVGVYNVTREYFDHRWVPGAADNSKAEYPAILNVKSTNNFVSSTQWLRNGNYLRVKSAEIGYNFPRSLTQRVKINSFRLFINGTNLGLWDHIKIVNPEDDGPNENYPLQRSINFGAQVTF